MLSRSIEIEPDDKSIFDDWKTTRNTGLGVKHQAGSLNYLGRYDKNKTCKMVFPTCLEHLVNGAETSKIMHYLSSKDVYPTRARCSRLSSTSRSSIT